MLNNDMRNDSLSNRIIDVFLSLFLDLGLSWNELLLEQIRLAKIAFQDCCSSWFFDFSYYCDVPMIQSAERVPIFVDISTQFIITGRNVHKLPNMDGNFWASEKYQCPPEFYANADLSRRYTSVYLHFKEGKICELEVVDCNGLQIEPDALLFDIACGQRVYRINADEITSELQNREI